jgi:RHS repeat-associated protein
VDSNDPWFYFCYDERWRSVATYRSTDSDPKERFAYHAAGLDGYGSSSYIDTVILRDKDKSSNWALAADGSFEERQYYCQNWRADVVTVVASSGAITEWTKYFAYGTPLGIPGGDTDSNGVTDSTDQSNVSAWASAYDVRADVDLSGAIDAVDDVAMFSYVGQSGGWQALSSTVVDNRKGYAGYENGGDATRFWHVRHRVLDSTLGRWMRRDPIGYVDGPSLLQYADSRVLVATDPYGLCCSTCMTVCAVIVGTSGAFGAMGCIMFVEAPPLMVLCVAIAALGTPIAASSCPTVCAAIGCCGGTAPTIPAPVTPTPIPISPITNPRTVLPSPDPPGGNCDWPGRIRSVPPYPARGSPINPGAGCDELYVNNSRICDSCTNIDQQVACIRRIEQIDTDCRAHIPAPPVKPEAPTGPAGPTQTWPSGPIPYDPSANPGRRFTFPTFN